MLTIATTGATGLQMQVQIEIDSGQHSALFTINDATGVSNAITDATAIDYVQVLSADLHTCYIGERWNTDDDVTTQLQSLYKCTFSGTKQTSNFQ